MNENTSTEHSGSQVAGALTGAGLMPPAVALQVDALYAALDRAGYYELLGVDISANRPTIQTAYHQLAVKIHRVEMLL